MISFQNEDLNDDLAVIVENDIIQAAINRQVLQVPDRVEVRYQSKAKSYKLPQLGVQGASSHAEVELESGELFRSRLLVSILEQKV